MLHPLLLIVSAIGFQAADPSTTSPGFVPTGQVSELADPGLLARLRDPRTQAIGFSSYDRKGGNNDGFEGTYSKLRMEDGNSVLAEADGPGIIQRIWFTHSVGDRPGLLNLKQEHLKIYLDKQTTPALDVPLEAIYSGTLPGFPRPLVSEGTGGFVSYVPIPYRDGCKVVVEGDGVHFYQIGILKLPPGATPTSFHYPPTDEQVEAAAKAASLWSHPEAYEQNIPGAIFSQYTVETSGNSTIQYALRLGPWTVRSLEIAPDPGTEDAWRKARLRILWDTDEAERAAVDTPLGPFFGVLEGEKPFQSLLVGQFQGAWYNRFPMPYHRQAIIQIDTASPLRGKLMTWTTPGVADDAGYLRANFREEAPTQAKRDFAWLNETGRGHYAGVLMMTEGKDRLPFWLEGDDRFTVDGSLAIHGTGSEDYFNCGWYAIKGRLDGPATYPVYGFPAYRNAGENWNVAAYRWHFTDPVPFAKSIEAGIEHGPENATPADYRAVVFWYSDQAGPTTAKP